MNESKATIKPQHLQDFAMNFFNRPICSYDANAFRIAIRQFQVSVSNFGIEHDIFLFKTALVFRLQFVPIPCAFQSRQRIDVEEKGDLGTIVSADEFGQLLYDVDRNSATVTLISQGRMIKTVADYALAATKRRQNIFSNVLATRCIEQKQYRRGSQMNG